MECGEEKRREFEIPCGILHSMDYVSPGKFSSKKRERKINAFAVRDTRERSSSTAFFFLVIFIIEQSREKQINENEIPMYYVFTISRMPMSIEMYA